MWLRALRQVGRRSKELGGRLLGRGFAAGQGLSPKWTERRRTHRHEIFELHGLGASGSCVALARSEEHTSELQSHSDLVCRLLLEKKKKKKKKNYINITKTNKIHKL